METMGLLELKSLGWDLDCKMVSWRMWTLMFGALSWQLRLFAVQMALPSDTCSLAAVDRCGLVEFETSSLHTVPSYNDIHEAVTADE